MSIMSAAFWETARAVVLLFSLGGFSLCDAKKRELPLLFLGIGWAVGVLLSWQVWRGAGGENIMLFARDLLCDELIGAVLFLVSVLSGGRMGKGDAILFLMIGGFLTWQESLSLLWMSSVLMGVFGIVCLLTKRRKKNDRLPFAPFVLGGYVLLWAIP